MTKRMHRVLTLTGMHFRHGNQGEVVQDFQRTTDIHMRDGYLDHMEWQNAVLAHCHIVHQMRTMQWASPLRYEMAIGNPATENGRRYVTFGAGQWGKEPSITALVCSTFMELLREADSEQLKAVVK